MFVTKNARVLQKMDTALKIGRHAMPKEVVVKPMAIWYANLPVE
jgi:hypothetical protein